MRLTDGINDGIIDASRDESVGATGSKLKGYGGYVGNNIPQKSDWLRRFVWRMATFESSYTIYQANKYTPRDNILDDSDRLQYDRLYSETHTDYVSFSTAQWGRALRNIQKEWKVSRLGCALIAPVSIALLQIDSVFYDVLARTAAITAFIFSMAGLILSANLMLIVDQFRGRRCRNAWIKASESFDDPTSVEFWSLLGFPLALLMWSMIPCIAVVFVLAWNLQDGDQLSDGNEKKDLKVLNIISGVFLMVLSFTVAAYMYLCKRISQRFL
ncbi:hypothetical protein BDN70DRAFT_942894 [Pholiota conissans]|uniref:Uncharacterized protein n=1 Tax=Pholiota conissans TaxID=109636 RepID=A0A9P5YZP0_9AGAR|nr:hypothetical protein BDN70DRAFT_942894 [Pholiota conissans]